MHGARTIPTNYYEKMGYLPSCARGSARCRMPRATHPKVQGPLAQAATDRSCRNSCSRRRSHACEFTRRRPVAGTACPALRSRAGWPRGLLVFEAAHRLPSNPVEISPATSYRREFWINSQLHFTRVNLTARQQAVHITGKCRARCRIRVRFRSSASEGHLPASSSSPRVLIR